MRLRVMGFYYWAWTKSQRNPVAEVYFPNPWFGKLNFSRKVTKKCIDKISKNILILFLKGKLKNQTLRTF